MHLWSAFFLLAAAAVAAAASEIRYRLVPLEVSRNDDYLETTGFAINDEGTVVGRVYRWYLSPYPSGSLQGVFIHSPEAGFQEIGDYQGLLTQPTRINNTGQFTVSARGAYYTNSGELVNIEYALRYTPDVGFERLGDFGERRTRALGINCHGTTVGQAYVTDDIYHAFLHTEARGMVDLGTFGGTRAAAIDINDAGYISGFVYFEAQGSVACVYHQADGLRLLGPGRALRITNRQVVLCDSDYDEPLLIFPNGRTVRIVGQNNVRPWFGYHLNDENVVVGEARRVDQPLIVGFIWTEGDGMVDLNTAIPPDSGWSLGRALSINNRGQITGEGYDGDKVSAYRLDPILPKPRITISGTNAMVSWSPNWPGLFVESAESLSSAQWQRVGFDSTNVINVAIDTPTRFFRLNTNSLAGLCCAPE